MNNWLGNLYYKFVKSTGKPDEAWEEDGWKYEVYYLNFIFFSQKLTHIEKIKEE